MICQMGIDASGGRGTLNGERIGDDGRRLERATRGITSRMRVVRSFE